MTSSTYTAISVSRIREVVSILSSITTTPAEIDTRNKAALELARSGLSGYRDLVLNAFLGKGPALQLPGDRGIIDSHRRRAEHLGQFFTPLPVVQFIHRMLAIEHAPSPIVADLSGCGSGRFFHGLGPNAHLLGIELDSDALTIARYVFPKANLVQDTLANRDDRYVADYVIGNPPFSDWLTQRDLPYELSSWGSLGPRSSIRSDIAAVELAFKAVMPLGFVAMIWPDEINDGIGDPMERSGDDRTAALGKWLKSNAKPVFRIHLGSSVFKNSGTEWRTSILCWQSYDSSGYSHWPHPLFERSAETIDDLDSILYEWQNLEAYYGTGWSGGIRQYASERTMAPSRLLEATPPRVQAFAAPEILTIQSPPDVVTVGFDEFTDSLTLAHDGGLASAIRLREWKDSWGSIDLSHGEDTEKHGWQYVLRARNYYGAPLSTSHYGRTFPDSIEALTEDLLDYGLHADFSVEVLEYLLKRAEWLKLHLTPMEHYVPTRDWLLIYLSKHGRDSEFTHIGQDKWGHASSVSIKTDDLEDWLSLSTADRQTHELNEWISKLVSKACRDYGVPEERALNESWVELHQIDGLRTVYSSEYAKRVELVKGISKMFGLPTEPFELFPYQLDDVARYTLRDLNVCYNEQATGKAIVLTLMALVYRALEPTLTSVIITESRLMEEFLKASFGKTQLPKQMRILEHPSDLEDDGVWIWVTSYDQIWRKPKGYSQTWADLLLKRGVGFMACDEGHTLAAKNTQRSAALREFAKHVPKRTGASGTIISNVPRNAVSIWTIIYGDNTPLNPWGYEWPIIEQFNEDWTDHTTSLRGVSQTREFGKKYVTVEWLTHEFSQTLSSGAHGREMPALKDENLEDWQKWMSTTIIRRRTSEPEVAPFARILEPVIVEHTTQPTLHHAAIIDRYTREAFNAMVAEAEKPKPCILPILTNVLFAGTIPQSPKISNSYIKYTEGLTSKQLKAVELALMEVGKGKKVMLASERPEYCVLMHKYFRDEYRIKGHVFTGKQSISERNRILTEMEADPESQLLFATIQTGGIGLNLPFIGSIVNCDYGWKDASVAQLARRICRPAFQTYYPGMMPTVHLLALNGSLDPYQRQVCRTKFSAKAEAIDFLHQDEEIIFESWSDMIFRFFRDKGYDFDSVRQLLKAA